MIYNAIVCDCANLFFRLKSNAVSELEIVKKMINYIEREVLKYLDKQGTLYLLFDQLTLSDLGEKKSFQFSLNERKKILHDYKINRTYDKFYPGSIELFRKYYTYKGSKIQLLYSEEYEADDFVEPLIQNILKKDNLSVALLSTDLDWARYIEENDKGFICHLINDGFKKPLTKKTFNSIYEFDPTPAANTLFKSLFGDSSDGIQGAIFIKKAKFISNIKIICRDYIKFISDNKLTIDDVLQQFKTANFSTINNKKEKDCFDVLYLTLKSVDLKVPILDKLFTNIKVIRSQLEGKSVEPYLHWNEENKKINDIINQSIYGINFKTAFGKV